MDFAKRKLKLRFYTDGYTGVGRAILSFRSSVAFNLVVRTGYNYTVDDGQLTSHMGITSASHSVRKSLLMSECILFLYKSVLPDRLMEEYKQARKTRKAVWLVDMDVQPPDEIATIFNNSYCHQYWQNNVTILGPTEIESPGINQTTLTYFSHLYGHLNV